MPAGPVRSVHGAFSIPSLDGIRAVAVMIVFVGHGLTVGGVWPGHVGVTVFFFLSGYLITTLLRREYDRTGRISLSKFYLRRAVRILPPAYITIAIAAFVGASGWLANTQNAAGVLAQIFNITNYYMIWSANTTGNASTGLPPESSMLWSLAVEEHFYLIFPAALMLMLRRRLTYVRVAYILIASCVAAAAWRVVLEISTQDFYRLYVASDTRFDGLLAGAAMALLWNPALGDKVPFGVTDAAMRWVGAPSGAFIFLLASFAPDPLRLTIADSAIYVALVPLFWFAISYPQGLIGRFLNHRWVVHLGVLSFSVYLLHRLVIGLLEKAFTSAVIVDCLALLLTLVVAQFMYTGVEKPLGRLRKRLEARGEVEVPAHHTQR